MAARSNAIGELTRFWLQSVHRCLVDEALPVPVPYGLSDIDLVAVTADSKPIQLLSGCSVGPRLIVETKDEHDWEPTGREFGTLLQQDIEKMGDGHFIPAKTKGVKFTMLKEEHYRAAADRFGTDEFDRLFVVHAIDQGVIREAETFLTARRIHFLGVRDVVAEINRWYASHQRKAALRHTLVGDLWHLLVGYCQYRPPAAAE